jgi:hypothetical protein
VRLREQDVDLDFGPGLRVSRGTQMGASYFPGFGQDSVARSSWRNA